ncbi:transposase [Streptomyces sp. NPDC008061]|uniref:IS110 family transposase n=1 Tax=Streptomyces sp. NPDC008061 TaxID=3364805 RepID=UPI0036E78FC6
MPSPGTGKETPSRGYRGDGKTDAKDAYVIADQARMRRVLQDWDEIAVDLKILTSRRYDSAADRTRVINRLRAQLLELLPCSGAGVRLRRLQRRPRLLTGYQTPAALRRIGARRLANWLKSQKVHDTQSLADAAVAAAQAQYTAAAGEATAADVVHTLTKAVLVLNEEIAGIDLNIATRQ